MTQLEQVDRVRTDETPELFTIYDDGVVLDITGGSFTLVVNDVSDGSGTDVITITGVIVDAPNGIVRFTPSTADAAVAAGTYYYQIQMSLAGVPSIPTRGTWKIRAFS